MASLETSANGPTIENPDALPPAQRWAEEIKMAEKELNTFHERARRVVKRYLDERDTLDTGRKWFNIFYANTQILESALYSQIPKPAVTRRFKDYDDDVARVGATILERCITQDLDDPSDTFDSTMRHAVQDRLVSGCAQAWLRLKTSTEDIEDVEAEPDTEVGEEAEEGADAEPLKRIVDQQVCVDYVFWSDFLWSPCRTWEEKRWVGRKVYMSREELVERFGSKGESVPLDHNPNHFRDGQNVVGSTPKNEVLKKATVYEIWEGSTKKVYWFARGVEFLLDEEDDPLTLEGFYPCPRPMLANISTSNTTPRPDYYMIQDQYTELDTVNNRISMLVQACKVVGVYDKAATGISRMLTEGFDNQLIPVDNWAAFAEKGGVKGAVDWLPLDVVVAALEKLNQARDAIKGQIYALTGIADIVRGDTKASETLGAQQIKAQFASVRIKKLQDEVSRFASDIMRIKAEIMVKHFDEDVLIRKSNIEAVTNDQPFIQPALEMLKTAAGFEWRVQVTADSIAQADYSMEKADRVELLAAVSGYLEKASTMFQVNPDMAPLMVAMLKWTVAGFRNSSELEAMLDRELDSITKNPTQPKPDPEAAKAQLEIQTAQQKAQMDAEAKQQDLALKKQLADMELQKKQMELQFKIKELELKEREMQMNMQYAEAEAARNERTALMEQQMNLESQAAQHAQKQEFSQQDHEIRLQQAKEGKKNGE